MVVTAALLLASGAGPAQSTDLYDPGVLRTFELSFAQLDWYDQIVKNKAGEIYIKADLRVDGRLYPDVGVRGRGGTAWAGTLNLNSRKLPFKISMDEFVADQELLGYANLVLNNGYRDPTFLREVLAFRAMRACLPAPQANLVKLVINNENWGIYINLQPIDSGFIRRSYRNATGNRYKGDLDLKYYGADPNAWTWPIRLKTPNGPPAYVDLIRAMYTTTILPLSQREQELPKLIDLDLAHRHLALNVLLGNTDSAPTHNYYLYLDPYHEQMRLLPWDMNVSLIGGSNGLYLVPRIFGDTGLWERRYRGHLRTAVESLLDWRVMGAWATAWHQMIDAEVKADSKKLYPYADFVANLATSSVNISPSVQISSLKAAVDGRRFRLLAAASLSGPRIQLAAATHAPVAPTHTQPLQFTVRASGPVAVHRVLLHYRSRGWFREVEMFDDGQHGDGAAMDGTYGIGVPAQPAGSLVSYYISAEADLQSGGDVNFLPTTGAYGALKFAVRGREDSVLIHEFVARNDKGLRDPAGERDDWIELFNPTANAVDLSGHHLTDNSAEPQKWTLPAATVVPAGGTLLVWADEQPSQIGLHAMFKLSGDGEEIALFEPTGQHALDVVRYGPQHKDVSTGRLFDRASPWVTYASPTPDRRNELHPCGARTWSTLEPDHQVLRLSAAGSMQIGTALAITLEQAPAASSYLLQFAVAPGIVEIPALGIWHLLDTRLTSVVLPTDNQGMGTLFLQLPNDPILVGQRVSLQALAYDRARFLASNGLEIGPCR